MELLQTTALVTGAARRVGREIALRLAGLGCYVVVHYRTSASEAEDTVRDIEDRGGRALAVQGDLAIREEALEVATVSLAWTGSLDILVNSAANFPRVEIEDIGPADWDSALDTNLLGPFWLAQKLGPQMQRKGRGKIVNIADVSWQAPWPSRLPYCVSKAGLVSLTIGLAKAFAPQVQVNAIGPGPILFPEDYTEEKRREVLDKTLLKRCGSPRDIADAVEFFCRCDYATGQFLAVDGGQSLPGV